MFNNTMHGVMNANYGEGHWMTGFHGPFSLIIWFLIIAAVVMIISRLWRGGDHCGHGVGKNALDILGQRFANGEIDEKEYREKRNVLKSRH